MSIHAKLKADEEAAEAELISENTEETPKEEAQASVSPDATPVEEPAPDKDWEAEAKLNEQRFKVLQGKYNAETKRMNEKIKSLEEQVSNPPAEKNEEVPEDDTIYEDFPELAAERKRMEVDRKRIDNLEQQLEQDERAKAEMQFTDALDRAIPDRNELDSNPQFLQWLGRADEMIGAVRQDLLNEAIADQDVERITAIVNAWRASSPKEATQPQQPPASAETPNGTAGTSTVATGQTYTESQVNAFYDALSKGHYRGREVERRQIEKEIDLAM